MGICIASKSEKNLQYSVITTVDSQGNEITVSGSIRNGNSQCPLYEDKEICDFAVTYCTKTVEVVSCAGISVIRAHTESITGPVPGWIHHSMVDY